MAKYANYKDYVLANKSNRKPLFFPSSKPSLLPKLRFWIEDFQKSWALTFKLLKVKLFGKPHTQNGVW